MVKCGVARDPHQPWLESIDLVEAPQSEDHFDKDLLTHVLLIIFTANQRYHRRGDPPLIRAD